MLVNRSVEQQEQLESIQLVRSAFHLAQRLELEKIVVLADELQDVEHINQYRGQQNIIWLTRESGQQPFDIRPGDRIARIPNVTLTRMSQIKYGMFLAILKGFIEWDETVLCVTGVVGSQRLDTLLIANARRDFPWIKEDNLQLYPEVFATRQLATVIDLALHLAAEGREGKPIGTAFILGEPSELQPYLKQLVLNPLAGHPQSLRKIHDQQFKETIREFASLDGAFIVNQSGVVETAGTYLDAPLNGLRIGQGLGARHTAAAAITVATNAIGIVLSSSSQTVTVFYDGKTVFELEKPVNA